jgi:multidrug resistance protein MdtO
LFSATQSTPGLDRVRDLADGVLLEFGPSRQRDLELRNHIRRWKPQLRTLLLMRISSLKYRLQFPGFELPESARLSHQAYDEHSAHILEEMAERIEGIPQDGANSIQESDELLNQTVEVIHGEAAAQLPPGRGASFGALLCSIDALTTSLASDIASEFGRAVEP